MIVKKVTGVTVFHNLSLLEFKFTRVLKTKTLVNSKFKMGSSLKSGGMPGNHYNIRINEGDIVKNNLSETACNIL
jgi:hypothetical protein